MDAPPAAAARTRPDAPDGDAVEAGRAVVRAEARALEALADRLGAAFEDAVRLISGAPVGVGVGVTGVTGRTRVRTDTLRECNSLRTSQAW
jgi:hypothetical protein